MYIWASAVKLGCSQEDSFLISTAPEDAVFVSSWQKWWKGAIGDALQLGTGAAPSTIRAVVPRSAARLLLLPQHHSRGCHSRLAGHIAKAIRCHTASQDCQQHLGQLENIHPPHCAPPLNQQVALLPAPAWSPVLLGRALSQIPAHSRSHRVLLNTLLVRQEGVSNIGNTHPVGSGWLHTAPLPSARKESASATLTPHMVTYNTSGFSFPLLSLMCLIFFNFLLRILETKLPQIFQGTTISGVKKDLHIPCFTNRALKAFWVSDSTWAEPECSLYISYQIQFLKGEEVSLIALIKECV